jgi:ribosomal protein S12 methylthiotransferase accessory factor YcaO
MKFLETAMKINVFDWFGLYRPLLETWKKNGLEVSRIKLASKYSDPVPHRIELRIRRQSDGSFIAGYGEDNSESRAYEKAICELREREVFSTSETIVRETTNGLAAHRFQSIAKRYAKAELIERDAFLRHWLTQTPFAKIIPGKDKETQSIIASIENLEHVVHVYSTFLGIRKTVVVAIENTANQGFVIGSSGIESEKKAIRKALREAYYNLAVERVEKVDWEKKNLLFHREYWYKRGQIPDWMRNNSIIPNTSKSNKQINFEFKTLDDGPVSVVAAFSKEIFDLWVGETPKQVLEKTFREYGIAPNLALHPFP